MINALTYLTRRCPRKCGYCALRDAKDVGPELTVVQWKRAFDILRELGVSFNLILGNETWLLGDALVEIMQHNRVPYALYTTCPEPLFSRYRDRIFQVVDNLSCGIDWPLSYLEKRDTLDEDTERKSWDAWQAFKWVKKHYPHVDCQGTVTVHSQNLKYLPSIVEELSELGVFVGINPIHWNSDGKFDFFPTREELKEYTISTVVGAHLFRDTVEYLAEHPGLIQNVEMLRELSVTEMLTMGWHCPGNPYGGPTIDSDGRLRLCGYRKGTRTPRFTIFDLPMRLKEWQQAVYEDSRECPGCAWSYPWMYHYWKNKDSNMGTKVFVSHAGEHIPQEKWSERRVCRW